MNSSCKNICQQVIAALIFWLIQTILVLLKTKFYENSITINNLYLLVIPLCVVLFVIIIYVVILMIKRIFVRSSNYKKWVEVIQNSGTKSNDATQKQNAIEIAKEKGTLFLLNNLFIWFLSAILSIVIVILMLLFIPQMAFWCVDIFN